MRSALLLCLTLVACASTRTRPAPVPRPADLPRSSIAALLAHSEELGLTPEQTGALQRRDAALERDDAPLLARISQGGASVAPAGGGPTASDASAGSGHGGHRGRSAQSGSAMKNQDLLTRLDDNDTRAYLEVEQGVLTESQRERARAIASRYREELYDRQHPARVTTDSSAAGR